MEIENLSEIKAKVEEMFKDVSKYTDMISNFKARLDRPLDYQEALTLLKELNSHGFLCKNSFREVSVSFITEKSRYNATRIWSEVNFERCDSDMAKSSIEMVGLIFKSVRQVIEDKTKELASSEKPIEEVCLQQVKLERTLSKFLSWWNRNGYCSHSVVDWENTPDLLQEPCYIWDYGAENETVYEKVIKLLDREIDACVKCNVDHPGSSDVANNWNDKDVIPFVCKNLLEFIAYI